MYATRKPSGLQNVKTDATSQINLVIANQESGMASHDRG